MHGWLGGPTAETDRKHWGERVSCNLFHQRRSRLVTQSKREFSIGIKEYILCRVAREGLNEFSLIQRKMNCVGWSQVNNK